MQLPRIAALLLIGLIGAIGPIPSKAHAAGAEDYRLKINAIDVTRAPEMTIFFSLLDPDGLPIPAKKVPEAAVSMNGKPIEKAVEVYSLKGSEHGVAVAMVACGYQAYAGPVAKAMGKGFEEFAKGFRGQDVATSFAYINNINNLNNGKFVPAGEASAAIAAVKPSDDAYQAKLFETLKQAIRIFKANDKTLPENRFIVIMADGADSSSESDDVADRKIYDLVREAKQARVRIMSIGYAESSDAFLNNLELLSRKSGGTYRKARILKDIPTLFKYLVAEIWGQMAVDLVAADVEAKREYRFALNLDYRGARMSTPASAPFAVKIRETHFRWRYWGIVALIILAVLLVLLAIVLIVLKIIKKRKKKAELAELKAQGKAPPMPGEVIKMSAPPGFGDAKKAAEGGTKAAEGGAKAAGGAAKAAGGAAKAAGGGAKAAAGGAKAAAGKLPEAGKPPIGGGGLPKGGGAAAGGAAAGGAAAGGAAAGGGIKEGGGEAAAGPKKCATCGRTMLPGWTKCMFCAAGIGKAKG